eukprot:6955233-Alexandrium_andersonii.AAC.1
MLRPSGMARLLPAQACPVVQDSLQLPRCSCAALRCAVLRCALLCSALQCCSVARLPWALAY